MNATPFAVEGYSPAASTWDILKVLLVLAIIVGLIVVLLRFFAKRNRGWWMNRSLRSLGGLPLGTGKSMQIVEWSGRIYVLGVGEDITLLEAITDPDTVASLLAEHDALNAAGGPHLSDWLHKWTGRGTAGGMTDSGSGKRPTFEQSLENRLRQLAERRQRVEKLFDDQPYEDRSDKP